MDALRYREQMQIMVAEHHLAGIAESADVAQRGKGFRAAVDDVAGNDDAWIGAGLVYAVQ